MSRHRKTLSNEKRPIKPILGEVWRIRTLSPFDRNRRTLAERESTLDGIVDITLSVVDVGRDKVRVTRLVSL
jgi:hypothetical protein